MSRLLYIASDYPLPPRHNPHERMLSVNEALALGISDIPEALFAPGFDRDKPNVILWMDRDVNFNIDAGTIEDGNFDDDFALFPAKGHDDVCTEKKYAVGIEWHAWTQGRAQGVIQYIRKNLAHTNEVEIWNIWMGFGEPPIIHSKTISIADLTPQDIQALTENGTVSTTMAGCEIPIQHRIVVTAV